MSEAGRICLSTLAALVLCAPLYAAGGTTKPAVQNDQMHAAQKSALDWVKAAVQYQLDLVNNSDGQYMRYLQQRVDARGNQQRDIVETREGFVSRITQQNGKPLTAEQNASEVEHLQNLMNSPDELGKHHKREQNDLTYTRKMIQQLTTAMIWTLVPEQTNAQTVVIDYKADPNYHPPSLDCAVLKSLSGRLWIDTQSGRMTRIEAHLDRDSDYGWGLLVHLNSGGKIILEQHPEDPEKSGHPHWETTSFEMHVTGSLLLLHHLNFDIVESHDHFSIVKGSPSYVDGIRMLLEGPAK